MIWIVLAVFIFLAVPSPHDGSLAAAQLPDVSPTWMRSIINNAAFRDSNGNQKGCVFYYDAGIHAKFWRINHNTNPEKLTIWEAYDNNLYMNENAGRLGSYFAAGEQTKYFQNQSQVFAEKCQGKAWLMMFNTFANGTEITLEPNTSIWTSHEFSTIKGTLNGANPSGVSSIERINPAWQSLGTVWTRPAAPSFTGKNLRILPLGDSITNGFKSTNNNGYRLPLENSLAGNTVDMVGNAPPAGSFSDNQNEGWSTFKIADLQAKIPAAVKLRPNVILLHIGSNNVNDHSVDLTTLPGQLGNMIDSLFTGCPDAVLIVAQLIPNSDTTTQSRTITYNNDVSSVVSQRASAGKHILLVNMFDALIAPSDLADGLHPNDGGYAKMADVWLNGIKRANTLGWIGTPVTVTGGTGGGKQQCRTSTFWYPANGDPAKNEIASGAGYGTDLFPALYCFPAGDALTPVPPPPTTKCTCTGYTQNYSIGSAGDCNDFSVKYPHAVRMVDLSGDGRADFIYVGENGQLKGYYSVLSNDGNADNIIFFDVGELAAGIPGCKREQIHLADIDGDGRPDYLCVRPDGSVTGYRNNYYPGKAGNINWTPYPYDIAAGVGKPGAGVRFADLSGDGRADYLYVYPSGAVDAWQNQPKAGDASLPSWLEQKTYNPVASGVGVGRELIRFADIDGDGRDDYISIDLDSGAVSWNRNMMSKDNGPNAASPVFDIKKPLAGGVDGPSVQTQFADLNGDGRADYIKVNADTSAVRAYFNGCNVS